MPPAVASEVSKGRDREGDGELGDGELGDGGDRGVVAAMALERMGHGGWSSLHHVCSSESSIVPATSSSRQMWLTDVVMAVGVSSLGVVGAAQVSRFSR